MNTFFRTVIVAAVTLFSGCATEEPRAQVTQYLPKPRNEEELYKQYLQLEDEYYKDKALANEHLAPRSNTQSELAEINRKLDDIKREQGWQDLKINQLHNREQWGW